MSSSRFSEEELLRFRGQLEVLKAELLPVESDVEKEGLTELSAETTDEISSRRLHPADLGTEEFERDLDLDIASGEITEIQAIDEALDRIDAGAFGVCQNCGSEITLRRLQAMPWVRFCAECERRFEKRAREIREAHQGGIT